MLCLHQDPEQHRVAESEPASRDRMGWRVDSDLPHKEAKQASTVSWEQLPPLRPQSYILLNSTAKVSAKGVTKQISPAVQIFFPLLPKLPAALPCASMILYIDNTRHPPMTDCWSQNKSSECLRFKNHHHIFHTLLQITQ